LPNNLLREDHAMDGTWWRKGQTASKMGPWEETYSFIISLGFQLVLIATLQFALLAGLDDFPVAHVLGVSGEMVLKWNVNDPIYDSCFPFKLHNLYAWWYVEGRNVLVSTLDMVSAHVVKKWAGLLLLWSCLLSTNIKGNHRNIVRERLADVPSEELVEKEDCLNTDLIRMEQIMVEGNWYKSHFVGSSLISFALLLIKA